MLQTEAEVFDEKESFSLAGCPPPILTLGDGVPVRFLFVRVYRP